MRKLLKRFIAFNLQISPLGVIASSFFSILVLGLREEHSFLKLIGISMFPAIYATIIMGIFYGARKFFDTKIGFPHSAFIKDVAKIGWLASGITGFILLGAYSWVKLRSF